MFVPFLFHSCSSFLCETPGGHWRLFNISIWHKTQDRNFDTEADRFHMRGEPNYEARDAIEGFYV
jgi:hypothetical protein